MGNWNLRQHPRSSGQAASDAKFFSIYPFENPKFSPAAHFNTMCSGDDISVYPFNISVYLSKCQYTHPVFQLSTRHFKKYPSDFQYTLAISVYLQDFSMPLRFQYTLMNPRDFSIPPGFYTPWISVYPWDFSIPLRISIPLKFQYTLKISVYHWDFSAGTCTGML